MKRLNCFKWLAVALLSCVFGLSAEAENTDDATTEGVEKLIIELVSGDTKTFEFNEKPQLLFSEDKLTVKTELVEAGLPYSYSEIKNIKFHKLGDPTSVDELKNLQDKTVSVKFTDANTFEVYGIDGKLGVAVYALDGKQMPLDADISDNAVVVHLNAYKSGTYIIKIGKQTYKVIKR